MGIRIPVELEVSDETLDDLARKISERLRSGERSPSEWRLIEERSGVSYTWGEDRDVYDPFLVYEGRTPHGLTQLAIGQCERATVRGQDRLYYIVILIGPQGGLRAVAEFLATDDYDETGEVIAIIKGKEGTARQFDSPDELPTVYARWKTTTYRDRVDYPGSYLKQGLICSERDHATMLNHSLAQIQLRSLE
jgi:hypothetical protein